MKKFLVALMAVLFVSINTAEAIEFTVQDKMLLMYGSFIDGDLEKFVSIIDENDVELILINSNGGLLNAALPISDIINEKDIIVGIPERASCLSACAFVWASSHKRAIQEGGIIGFHTPYSYDENNNPIIDKGSSGLLGFIVGLQGYDLYMLHDILEYGPDTMLVLDETNRDEYFTKWNVPYDFIPKDN